MDEIILFDKSFQERLSEYEKLFSGANKVPYSTLQNEFSFYLELAMDGSGWQAIWKIPRLKCEEFKIHFPTIVLVYVINISFSDLTALVKILAVQDDIHLPEKHHVLLAHLWPTKKQDRSIALNIEATANALDIYRFFNLNLLMPWDEDEDSGDWVQDHLISRLKFYYDLRNGNIPIHMCEHINSLINEAKRLRNKREQLTNTCDDLDSDVDENNVHMKSLIEMNVRLIQIQNEVNILENTLFRKVILNRQDSDDTQMSDSEDEDSRVWIVTKPAKAANYIELFKLAAETNPNEHISISANLMGKLKTTNPDEIILLSPEAHKIKDDGVLIDSCVIKGINPNQHAQIVSLTENVMFDCVGNSVILENLTLDCRKAQCGLLVRKGRLTMKNCNLIGDRLSTIRDGVLVLKDAELALDNCVLSGFSTAIVGNSGSSISIRDCTIKEAMRGILIHSNCQLDIKSSSIESCKDYGVVVETQEELPFNGLSDSSSRPFDDLKSFSYISVDNLQGGNNAKGDFSVKKCNIKARDNLFDNPEFDPTFIENDEDDKDMTIT